MRRGIFALELPATDLVAGDLELQLVPLLGVLGEGVCKRRRLIHARCDEDNQELVALALVRFECNVGFLSSDDKALT